MHINIKESEKIMDERSFYPHSLEEAARNNCIDLYKESVNANIDCKNAIEEIIKENFDGSRLKENTAKKILEQFGIDRVDYVLSATLQSKASDGRFSEENIKWAKETFVPNDIVNGNNKSLDYVVNAHSAVLNGFVNQVQEELKLLNFWDKSQVNSPDNLNFEDKLMVVSQTALKEGFKTRADQLIFCSHVGSIPEKNGKMVYGVFLSDGEKAQFQRQDFLGEAKEEFLSSSEKQLKAELLILTGKNEIPKEKKPSVLGRLENAKKEITQGGKEVEKVDRKDER